MGIIVYYNQVGALCALWEYGHRQAIPFNGVYDIDIDKVYNDILKLYNEYKVKYIYPPCLFEDKYLEGLKYPIVDADESLIDANKMEVNTDDVLIGVNLSLSLIKEAKHSRYIGFELEGGRVILYNFNKNSQDDWHSM